MNDNGLKQAAHLEKREYSPSEFRTHAARTRILETLLHCSAEIDDDVLRYFSIHGIHLKASQYQIILLSSSNANENRGSLYDRMGQYPLIQEIANETFGGLCSFYAAEADGRFVMLLLEPDSIAEGGYNLDDICRSLCTRCKTLYGITAVAYISEPIQALRRITPLYNKLRENATLHHFTERAFEDPVVHGRLPQLRRAAMRLSTIQDYARALAGTLASGGNYHEEADRALYHFAYERANSVDDLLRLFGDYFELSCQTFGQLGISVDTDSLRREQFDLYEDSIQWRQIAEWFHLALDSIHANYVHTVRESTMRPFQTAIEHIENNLSDPALTVEDCALAAGCSSTSLQKMFRSRLDTSISSYIRKQRLSKARELLLAGTKVKDACLEAGFASIETFHRVFKAEYGVTPGQIQKTN